MRPELKKTLTGKYVIKYDCPGCGDRLSSSLDDAGTRDTCPGCGASFDVPGVAEKEKLAHYQLNGYSQRSTQMIRSNPLLGLVFAAVVATLYVE